MRTVLYHRTDQAEAILSSGFKDSDSTTSAFLWSLLCQDTDLRGVFLSDVALDANEGTTGDQILRVTLDVPLEDLEDFEIVEEEKPYREWVVPAAFIAKHGIVEMVLERDCPCRFGCGLEE